MGIKYTLCKSQDSKTMENALYKNELSGFHYKCCGIRNGKYLSRFVVSKYYMIQLDVRIAARIFKTAWLHMRADLSGFIST